MSKRCLAEDCQSDAQPFSNYCGKHQPDASTVEMRAFGGGLEGLLGGSSGSKHSDFGGCFRTPSGGGPKGDKSDF